MGISNGDSNNATEVVNAFGSIFNDIAQNLFDADYNGFDSRLNAATGSPALPRAFFDTFKTDSADVVTNLIYDATNDYYRTVDDTEFGTHYVVIEATSFGTWSGNNTNVTQVSDGKWVVWCDTGTDAVKRAQVHKSLWFGTDGTDLLIDDFTSITATKTSTTRDVSARATLSTVIENNPAAPADYTGTFNDTTNNTDCSSWSNLVAGATDSMNWNLPVSTGLNSAANGSSNELGTDREADENSNPADCKLNHTGTTSASNNGQAVILHQGTISWSNSGFNSVTTRDFVTDGTLAGVLTAVDADEFDDATLILKETASASTDNVIPIINSVIDGANSMQISISTNGGAAYTNVNNTELAVGTSGTALWTRMVITRVDTTTTDIISEYAIKWGLY